MTLKVLLTGGAGFIGARLTEALVADGAQVDVVDNLSRGSNDAVIAKLQASGKMRFLTADLLQPDALASFDDDYDLVVHLAAIVGVQNVLERPYQTLRDNVILHEAAIRFAERQKKLQRFLFASTSEVYAGSLIHLDMPLPTPESTPLALPALADARTSYMLSKIYGEAMLIHSGLPYTVVRPHNVYGPRMGMAHVIPQLLEKAHRAEPGSAIEVFSTDHRRTFCYIDDAVEMMMRLLKTPQANGQVVNLGSEAPEISIGELAQVVIDTVGKPLTITAMPATPGSPTRRAPAMGLMVGLTGYAAETDVQTGVQQTYDWYKANVFA